MSENTVYFSFRSRKRMGLFSFLFIKFYVLNKLWTILRRRIHQSREGSLSAQHYCKYLGPRLSHSFTTVETCQATKLKETAKLMWFNSILVTENPATGRSASKTGLSKYIFFKCSAPVWGDFSLTFFLNLISHYYFFCRVVWNNFFFLIVP